MTQALHKSKPLAAGMREEAASFTIDGEVLRGNLVLGGTSEVGALLLHGWGGVRSGPHNLLTFIAHRLAAAGIPSLRFDFRGRGESEGEGTDISLGHMGEDALAAARFLQERGSVRKVYLMGICSGGNVAIGILDRLPAASGLYLLSVYPFGDGDSFQRDASRTAHYLKEYWRKLWLPATWRKFMRGELFYREIAKVLFGHFRQENKVDQKPAADQKQPPLHNLLKTPIPIHMVYGEADPDYQASYTYFQTFSDQHQRPIQFRTIPGANHNFYSLAWKQQLADELVALLESPASTTSTET